MSSHNLGIKGSLGWESGAPKPLPSTTPEPVIEDVAEDREQLDPEAYERFMRGLR